MRVLSGCIDAVDIMDSSSSSFVPWEMNLEVMVTCSLAAGKERRLKGAPNKQQEKHNKEGQTIANLG